MEGNQAKNRFWDYSIGWVYNALKEKDLKQLYCLFPPKYL